MDVMPKWAEVVLVPLISLLLAAILSALVILGIGEDPVAAVKLMVSGALGSTYGWGYTLYYATNFMFTGLCVAIAFHARLFNIGGEGQAMLGGLGVALACLYIPWPHWSLALIGAAAMAAVFGAAWAAIPAFRPSPEPPRCRVKPATHRSTDTRDTHFHIQQESFQFCELCVPMSCVRAAR